MKLSVLMSIYNKENPIFFQEAMESIWDKQTLKPDEIVLVQDGILTGDLYHLIAQWQKKLGNKLISIKSDKNQGLAKALNLGIKYCSGDFIARMDTDDISEPKRFEMQIFYLQNNLDIDVLGGAIQEFNESSGNMCVRTYPHDTESIKKFISKACPLAHPTVMFRRSVFDNNIRYSELYPVTQDLELWFRLLKLNYKLANIPDIILHLRVSKDFHFRRSKNKSIKEFKLYWFGILDIYGLSWRLIYPLLRLGFRFLPSGLIQRIYSSKLRRILN